MQPAQYHRKTKQWRKLLGKTGVVLLATRIEVTTKELEGFLPYSFLLIELDGGAQRIPVITGSVTELYSILNKTVTAEEVNAAMKAASNESFGYNEDEIVSSDVIGISYGSLFDATQTKVMTMGDKQMVKTVSWYDNEMSYVSQLVRTVNHFAKLIG